MEGFHPDWQGYFKPLIALIAPKNLQEHISKSIDSFRPKSCFPCDKYLELKCMTYSELINPTPTPSATSPSKTLLKSPYSISNSNCVILGNRTGNYLGGIDILNVNWMNKVRYETPALYILCFDWQKYPINTNNSNSEETEKNKDQEIINELENDALNIIKNITPILKKRQSPPSVLIFVILPSGTPDPQSCVTCFRRNHFPELQAIFVKCGLKHQKQLNIRIERLAEMAYETAQAYYSENERRWRKSAIKAQTAGITASSDSFIGSLSMKSSSTGLRYSVSNSIQSSLSPRFGRNSFFSAVNSSSNSVNNLLKNVSLTNANTLSRSNKNNSFASSTSGNGCQTMTQLQSKVLLIRYCIKSAVMNEFCGNFALAVKQYIAAWDNIMNETSIPSYQFVILCNIISLRLYHIHVINGEIQKAMIHLKIHCRTLREFGTNHPKFKFLSSLWLSQTLQKLASVLFFHLVNKSFIQDQSIKEDTKLCQNNHHKYPDGLEFSLIPLSIGNKNEKIISRISESCRENCAFKFENENLGDILSSIARSIQNIVININNNTQCDNVISDELNGKDDSNKIEDRSGITILNNNDNQNNMVLDTLINISKLYKTSAEYSHLSKSQLIEFCNEFDTELFSNDQEIGGEILPPLSLGCFEELSSPETFLEYERKGLSSTSQHKTTFDQLSKLCSLYIGSDSFDIDQIEDRSIASEVLASCEIVRRNIKSLINSKSLFYRSISLFYTSAVIYRHFYPINLFNTISHHNINLNTNTESEIPQKNVAINNNNNNLSTLNSTPDNKCNQPAPAMHVDNACQSGCMQAGASMADSTAGTNGQNAGELVNVGSGNFITTPTIPSKIGAGQVFGQLTDRFFQMISLSFAEYLFEENYINCSLSIFEAIFQSIVPKHVFAEISRLTTIDEQQNKFFGKRKARIWEIVNPQMTNTCFQITNSYFDSNFWLFLKRVCTRILECLSIQNLNLEERKNIPKITISNTSSESKLFGNSNINNSNLYNNSNIKQDGQYIYSVVSSFLAVLKPKRTWTQGQNQCKHKNTIPNHCSILILSYLIISNSLERDSETACKIEIEAFYKWIQVLYYKVLNNNITSNNEDDHSNNISNSNIIQQQLTPVLTGSKAQVKNILFTHFLHNNYSTILQDQSIPDRIIIMIHHFPTFLNVFINSRMETTLVTNIGILGVIIEKFEVVEFEEVGRLNSQLSLHCRIRRVNYIPQNYEDHHSRKLFYQVYRPSILIFGIFLYLCVSNSNQANDYIKFGINTLKYFNYQKSISNLTGSNIYNFSYVQFCLRNPSLSYFTCIGSWLRHSRTLIYNTPNLQIVPGGFLDLSTNSIANPVPIYKVPVDDLQILSKFSQPFNSLPIFHKLVTNNIKFNDQLSSKANNDEIGFNIESIKKLCKVWLLSPFNALDVLLTDSKQRIDTIESIAYNAISNEIRPLQLVLRIPKDFSEKFILDISVKVGKLITQDPYFGVSESEFENKNDSIIQREEDIVSKLGILQIPTNNKWEIVFSQNTISSVGNNDNNNNAIHYNSYQNNSLTPYSSTIGRFTIDGKLLRRSIVSEVKTSFETGIVNTENVNKEVGSLEEFTRMHSLINKGEEKTITYECKSVKSLSDDNIQFVGFDPNLANETVVWTLRENTSNYRDYPSTESKFGSESKLVESETELGFISESGPLTGQKPKTTISSGSSTWSLSYSEEKTVSFIDENITPYFKILKNGAKIDEYTTNLFQGVGEEKDKEEERRVEKEKEIEEKEIGINQQGEFENDSIFSTLDNSSGVLLFIPMFLSINKGGNYKVSVNVKILNQFQMSNNKDLEAESEEKLIEFSGNLILHDLEHSRPWYVGECITVNSIIPKMDSLHGCVNYLDKHGEQLEHRVVPLYDSSNEISQFFLSFEVTNQRLKEKIVIEDFVLPFKFSIIDNRYPTILDGNETNTNMINILKEDFDKYYLIKNKNQQSISNEIISNEKYHPKLIASLEYKLSCDVSSFKHDNEFLQFIIFPFQTFFSFNLESKVKTEKQNTKSIHLKSFPIKYELFSNLYNSLISSMERFYPITLETHVKQLSHIGNPFIYEAVITNHTSLPQPIKYSLIYPPNHPNSDQDLSNQMNNINGNDNSKNPSSLHNSVNSKPNNNQNLPVWLPLLVQGVTSCNILLRPNSTETIYWTCIPTQAGTIPLPCIYIQSERSNKQFIDIKSHKSSHFSSKKSSHSNLVSVVYTSEKRIVVIPRQNNRLNQ
ncbi:unnamed protein product [Cryptosporidium hominis]|uniref:Trafficking protein particle complex subunit 11 domain-containing protein n=1 Tax=Cryptosporidium hominis TaxID=237895 RepID=A0A0S4TB39_CRYHO|nr:hypothetical protein ChTU502y2012_387g0120 [Cryptosporidium hominis]PPA63645.1 hypothetical protein ChUKH1_08895 [Cryptosporidium hominis]CUV04413.1 unnamed protein product [Cryptosporidium hominis]